MIRRFMAVSALLSLVLGDALAGTVGRKVTTYEGEDGSEVSIVSYKDDDGADEFLIYFQGFESEWDDQAIVHEKTKGATSTKYVTRGDYQSIVDTGAKSKKDGAYVPQIEVYAKGVDGKRLLLMSKKPKHTPEEILKAYQR